MLDKHVSMKLVLAIPAITILFLWGMRQLRVVGVISFWEYWAIQPLGILMITLFTIWSGLKLAPKGFATQSETAFSVSDSFDEVCKTVSTVVSSNHWRLEESDLKNGHFKVKIGMSLHTFSSTMLIDVSNVASHVAKVHVFCGTRSLSDPKHNDRMITKFQNGLMKAVNLPT